MAAGTRKMGEKDNPGAEGQRRRVLVIDDAEGIRTYLANWLELKGFEVDTAEDGRRGVALLEQGASPDVVILDIMMPNLDGIETLRRIRDFDPTIPVVMLSVVGKASSIVEAMQLGAADYLNKPFEDEERGAGHPVARPRASSELERGSDRPREEIGELMPQSGDSIVLRGDASR